MLAFHLQPAEPASEAKERFVAVALDGRSVLIAQQLNENAVREKDDLPAATMSRTSRATGSDRGAAESDCPAHDGAESAIAVDGAPERELYDEYVCELDKVPVLTDLVAVTQRILQPDFRDGQRPDVRRAPRPDPLAVREAGAREAAVLYVEYSGVGNGTAAATDRTKRGKRGVSARAKGAAAKRSGKGKRGKGRGRSNRT